MLLSIVIPVYNSEKTIGRLVESLFEELNTLNFEIILVNDGSKDASEAVCENLTVGFRNVTLVSLRKNFGEFNAVMCGFNHAIGDFCVVIDDDFQNPPTEIIKLLQTAQHGGFDVVYSFYAQKQHSIFRNVGSWLANAVATWLLDKPKNLYLSSFKIIKQELVQEIIKYQGPFPYIDALIFRATTHVGRVQVQHVKRVDGRSGYSLKKLISLFLVILFCHSAKPLRLLLVLGFGLIAFGFFGAFLFPNATMSLPQHLFLVGLQFLGMGVLGEYLGKMFLQQSGIPQFVIKKIVKSYD